MSHRKHTSPGKHARVFTEGEHDVFIDAGYHEQVWGTPATPDHELLGEYVGFDEITVTVSYVKHGVSGNPEFELAWLDGHKVTVLDDATAIRYLLDAGCAVVEP